MRNLLRWPLLLLIPLLCCAITASLIYVYWFDTNFGCFGTFSPSQADIEKRANVNFPPSTSNLEWECYPGIEGDLISVRYTIAPGDTLLITHAPSYYEHYFGEPPDFFFNLFDDDQLSEENLVTYSTWQGDSPCGWTNLLVKMDDPNTYTVYAVYQDWDDCSFFDLTIAPFLP